MLREYKFIRKIEKNERLIIWIKEICYLFEIIENNRYDFIKNRIWIDLHTYNHAISKGIDIGEIRF